MTVLLDLLLLIHIHPINFHLIPIPTLLLILTFVTGRENFLQLTTPRCPPVG